MLLMKKVSDALIGSRILLVDDSVSFQLLTGVLLNSFGVASVSIASSLTEGMYKMNYLGPDKFATPKIDLILMDINLPDGNGIEACEYLSSYASNYNIPVVVVSGSSDSVTINKAFEAGASDYLQKPLARSLLQARLGMLMAMKSLESDVLWAKPTPDQSLEYANTGT
jgi:CheY-like chemotaxis protein